MFHSLSLPLLSLSSTRGFVSDKRFCVVIRLCSSAEESDGTTRYMITRLVVGLDDSECGALVSREKAGGGCGAPALRIYAYAW